MKILKGTLKSYEEDFRMYREFYIKDSTEWCLRYNSSDDIDHSNCNFFNSCYFLLIKP